MTLTDFVERVGRTIFEAPFGGGPPRTANHAELAEIRHAILDEIDRKSQRSGGHNLFPYNRVGIRIRGADAQQLSALEGDFLREYFEKEIRQALAKSEAQYPEDLRVAVEVSSEAPAKGEQWLAVITTFEEPLAQPKPRDLVGRLLVVQGTSGAEPEVLLDKPRVNIGRSLDVYRTQGRRVSRAAITWRLWRTTRSAARYRASMPTSQEIRRPGSTGYSMIVFIAARRGSLAARGLSVKG
jgi:hypothetical protein